MPRSVFTDAYGEVVRSLIEARKSSGLRQVELAGRLAKPQSFVSKVEAGERRLDVIEFLVYARAIGIDPVALLSRINASLPCDLQI